MFIIGGWAHRHLTFYLVNPQICALVKFICLYAKSQFVVKWLNLPLKCSFSVNSAFWLVQSPHGLPVRKDMVKVVSFFLSSGGSVPLAPSERQDLLNTSHMFWYFNPWTLRLRTEGSPNTYNIYIHIKICIYNIISYIYILYIRKYIYIYNKYYI